MDKIGEILKEVWVDGTRCATTPNAIPGIYLETKAREIQSQAASEIKKELEELLLSYRIRVVKDIIESPGYKKFWQGRVE